MDGQSFFCVWNRARGIPTVRHSTPEAANSEATRLARLHPGEEFFVLEATRKVVKDDVRIEHLCWPPF